jgi:hypothetical protein
MGAPPSVQYVIQGSIIALGMAIRYLPAMHREGRLPQFASIRKSRP